MEKIKDYTITELKAICKNQQACCFCPVSEVCTMDAPQGFHTENVEPGVSITKQEYEEYKALKSGSTEQMKKAVRTAVAKVLAMVVGKAIYEGPLMTKVSLIDVSMAAGIYGVTSKDILDALRGRGDKNNE